MEQPLLPKNRISTKGGKSKSNSQKYQCKECKKYTNVLPTKRESTTYHQKRNDVLPSLFQIFIKQSVCKKNV